MNGIAAEFQFINEEELDRNKSLFVDHEEIEKH